MKKLPVSRMAKLFETFRFKLATLALAVALLSAGSSVLFYNAPSPGGTQALMDDRSPSSSSSGAPKQGVNLDVPATHGGPLQVQEPFLGLMGAVRDFFFDVIRKEAPAGPAHSEGQPAVIPISSDNVEFVANFPLPAAIGGHFQKRETPNGARTYFFATGLGGLQVFDATNPKLPIQIGSLQIPHYENEDVDLSGNTLLISGDGDFNSQLYVIDVSIPESPRQRGSLRWRNDPARWGNARPGHIASCILDCKYAWVTGANGKATGESGWVAVVDLTQDAPRLVTAFQSLAGKPNAVFKRGTIHDVNEDGRGLVWLTGSGGISAVSIGGPKGGTPEAPVPIAHNDAAGLNNFILHNSIRASPDLVLVTEEDWEHTLGFGTGAPPAARKPNSCTEYQGRFETYRYDEGAQTITPIAQFKPEYLNPTQINGRSPVQAVCSSHWFDYRADGLVATGWYNQGVRFLDVTDPSNIGQVGWWLPPGATVWASYFHPDDSSIVYVADNARGLDIIHKCEGRCRNGGAISTPASTVSFTKTSMSFSPVWGYACPRVQIDDSAGIAFPVRRD